MSEFPLEDANDKSSRPKSRPSVLGLASPGLVIGCVCTLLVLGFLILERSAKKSEVKQLPAGLKSGIAKDAAGLELKLSDPSSYVAEGLSKLSQYGKVSSITRLGDTQIYSFVYEKDGKRSIFYTDSRGSVFFTGSIWNADNGKLLGTPIPIAQAAIPSVQPSASANANAMPNPAVITDPGKPLPPTANPADPLIQGKVKVAGAMDGQYKGEVSESIKTVASLAGYTEGKGAIGDTVYVIIDPRCPVCRLAYKNTREYIKRGKTIKWIPTSALGKPEAGNPLAATILESKDPKILERILANHEVINTPPSKKNLEDLNKSLTFLFAAFERNNPQQGAGVPTAFFVDHRTGKPRMLAGFADEIILTDVFGSLE